MGCGIFSLLLHCPCSRSIKTRKPIFCCCKKTGTRVAFLLFSSVLLDFFLLSSGFFAFPETCRKSGQALVNLRKIPARSAGFLLAHVSFAQRAENPEIQKCMCFSWPGIQNTSFFKQHVFCFSAAACFFEPVFLVADFFSNVG